MRVLVGITGGIAAYKSAELVRLLVERGHEVRCVPTTNALRFIGLATLEALSHNPVHSELYDDISDVRHVELAQWADLIIIAPATASFLARTANGLADDLLGNVVLASRAPKLIAPAMHTEMWENPSTISNVKTLQSRGIVVMTPDVGRLTGKDSGVGRLPEPLKILEAALSLGHQQDLAGKRVLVLAGGTREPLDPVRYIGNRSSGKQGIALAEVARQRGAAVTLIAANIYGTVPGAEIHKVETVDDIQKCIGNIGTDFDFVLVPAAISDYRAASVSPVKIKKSSPGSKMSIELTENPDIISGLVRDKDPKTIVVGFAAETASGETLVELALEKLKRKHLDLIVANDVSEGKAFDHDYNEVAIVERDSVTRFAGTKDEIASAIFDLLLAKA